MESDQLKLLTFDHEGQIRPGVLDGDEVVDLAAAGLPVGRDGDLALLVEAGEPVLGRVRDALKSADAKRYALSDVKIAAPILAPSKIVAWASTTSTIVGKRTCQCRKSPCCSARSPIP